jgi:hypothetical protein
MLKEAGAPAAAFELPHTPQAHSRSHDKTRVAFWKLIPRSIYLGLSGLGSLAVLVTLLQAYPWLSIEDGQRLDSRNELSQMFMVVNDGYMPLTKLDAICDPHFKATSSVGGSISISDSPAIFKGFAENLGHDGHVTIPCFRIFQMGSNYQMSEGTTLNVAITYAFWGLNYPYLRRSQVFQFRSVRGRDGTSQWQYLS